MLTAWRMGAPIVQHTSMTDDSAVCDTISGLLLIYLLLLLSIDSHAGSPVLRHYSLNLSLFDVTNKLQGLRTA